MAYRGGFEPTNNAHTHRFRVLPGDIDELGHANNVVWVRWVNEAAIAHAEAVGFDVAGLARLSVFWVVRRHDIEYLLPALVGEQLEAVTWAHSLAGATSQRRTLIKRDGRVCARADTIWALLDASTGRPRRIPPELLAAYGFDTLSEPSG
jgi:acyl-CoA thioester hydrolase